MDEHGQDEYRHQEDHGGRHRGWRPMSVWRSIGIAAAVAAVAIGLGFVGYIAIIAMAFSAWGSNK